MWQEFRAFILRGNVVELAVAVVIGAAFKEIVDAVVDIFTNVAAIPGKTDFSGLEAVVGGGTFRYGALLNAVFSFLVISAVVFFAIVKPLNAVTERRRAEGPETEEPKARPEDVLLLEEIRDLLRAQAAGGAPAPR